MSQKITVAEKLAQEIVNVLKYNPELSYESKVLAVESRLIILMSDVERGCDEAHKRSQDNSVFVDARPQDIPALRDMILKSQKSNGPAN